MVDDDVYLWKVGLRCSTLLAIIIVIVAGGCIGYCKNLDKEKCIAAIQSQQTNDVTTYKICGLQ